MEWNIESIIFYVLLLDATGAAWIAWCNKQNWWQARLGSLAHHFPITKGWTTLYLLLVLLFGWMLGRNELLTPIF